jgi:serine/threonine protein kinase
MSSGIRLINKGSYGCIYYPGIKCDAVSKETDQYITKIQEKTENVGAENEIQISNRIKTLPFFDRYFAPILSSCDLKIATLAKTLKDTATCDPIQEAIQENQSFLQSNKIRYLGDTTIYKDWNRNLEIQNPKFVFHILVHLFYLLNGISLLLTKQIIHNDIKENNIMIDPNRKKPILIDFGQSMVIQSNNIAEIPSFFLEFEYQKVLAHPFYSIDVALISYIANRISKENKIQMDKIENTVDILGEFKESLKKIWFEKNEITNPMSACITLEELSIFQRNVFAYLEKVATKTWKELYEELVGYYQTWDSYSIYCMYVLFYTNSITRIPKNNKVVLDKCMEILKTQIYSIPEKRLSIQDTKSKIKELL